MTELEAPFISIFFVLNTLSPRTEPVVAQTTRRHNGQNSHEVGFVSLLGSLQKELSSQ